MIDRIRSQAGFSMSEVVVVMSVVLILSMAVQARLTGVKNSSRFDVVAGQMDSQTAQIMSWASGQEDPGAGASRLDAINSNLMAQITRTSPWIQVAAASDVPAEKQSAWFKDVQGDADRLRITHCRDGDPANDRFCLRVDIYPWGNRVSGDKPIAYKFVECIGNAAGCGKTWTVSSCSVWPRGNQINQNPNGMGAACPVDTSNNSSPQPENALPLS